MKKLTLILTAITAIGITGCKKYLDQSVNPNQPSTVSLQLALPGAEKRMADIVNSDYEPYGVWVGYWAASSGFIIQPNLQEYIITSKDYNGQWNDYYLNLSNINYIQTTAAAQGAQGAYYQAIAMIMSAYDFQGLVDNFNDCPYSEAFNPKILTPKYDKGPDIYAALLKQLDAAIAMINGATSAAVAPSSDDVMFNGNMTSWKKFANTIKLRLVMRQSNLSTFSSLKTELASTAAEGYLDGTTQATVNPGYALNDAYGGQESPFYRSFGFNQSGNPTGGYTFNKANTYSVNLLNSFNDPRVSYYYAKANGIIKGVYLGDPAINSAADVGSNLSSIGPGLLKTAAMPAIVFSGWESLFLQAEAAQDGMIPGQAQTFYEAAITASFENLGLQASDASAYYSQNIANVGWTASSDKLTAIYTQKYISLNGYGNFEAYNEQRRTGIPASSAVRSKDPSALGTSTQIPVRVYYPQSEVDANTANANAEGTINEFTSKIFWANPNENSN